MKKSKLKICHVKYTVYLIKKLPKQINEQLTKEVQKYSISTFEA